MRFLTMIRRATLIAAWIAGTPAAAAEPEAGFAPLAAETPLPGECQDGPVWLAECERQCKSDVSDACLIAALQRDAKSTEVDKRSAMALFEQACELGNAVGCIGAGDRLGHADGTGVASTRRYEQACALGSARGCYNAGQGWTHAGRHEEAATLFARGCALGLADACATPTASDPATGRAAKRRRGTFVAPDLNYRMFMTLSIGAGVRAYPLRVDEVNFDGVKLASEDRHSVGASAGLDLEFAFLETDFFGAQVHGGGFGGLGNGHHYGGKVGGLAWVGWFRIAPFAGYTSEWRWLHFKTTDDGTTNPFGVEPENDRVGNASARIDRVDFGLRGCWSENPGAGGGCFRLGPVWQKVHDVVGMDRVWGGGLNIFGVFSDTVGIGGQLEIAGPYPVASTLAPGSARSYRSVGVTAILSATFAFDLID